MNKYGFYNTDNATLVGDGNLWYCGINIIKCEKADTGERIIISNSKSDSFHFEKEASVYRLILDKNNSKYSDIPKDSELYVAIAKIEEWDDTYLVCCDNTYWDKVLKKKRL